MEKKINTPHDSVFRQFLSRADVARDFMEAHLPLHLRELCDFSTLKLASGSFVEDDMRAFCSDILWSVQTRRGDGYVYVLIEHQSTPDRHMALRLMRYALAAIHDHLKAGHHRAPLVIPVVYYAGRRRPYPYALNWLEAFDDPQLAAEVYSGDFRLVDVTALSDEEIMEHRSMAALTLLQKHLPQNDVASLTGRLATLMNAEWLTGPEVKLLVNYLLQAGDTADVGAFLRDLAARVPKHEGELMTIAEKLKQEGRKEGLTEGRKEGHKDIAQKLLKSGMSPAFIQQVTGLTEQEIKQLQH